MPNSGGSWVAAGITKVRVKALLKSGPLKSVLSQRVAAGFCLALLASVPTHGWSIDGTGGRSASTSSAGCRPTGTTGESFTLGAAVQVPASGSVHSPDTALANRSALGARAGSLAGSVV